MEVSVITHPKFRRGSDVREAVRIVNQEQKSFTLLTTEADWIPEITPGAKSVDPNQVFKVKIKALGSKPSILITRRPLKGGFFSEYKPNFYLISTSAWERAFPNRPLHLYLLYLMAGILSYFPIRLSQRASDHQCERHENETIGCINDYCNVFEDIWQSMLKAQICPECENDLITFGAQTECLDSVKQILVTVKDIAWQHEQVKYEPAAFMSYTHFDDEHSKGALTELRDCLSKEVRAQTGEEFPIFQDRKDIKWGQNWRQRIDESINEVTFLIPIITPSFFKSQACRDEVRKFLGREARLKRNDLILPIYYIDTPLMNDRKKREGDDLAQAIVSHQYADWRPLRFEPFTSSVVMKTVAHLANQVADVLERIAPQGPPVLEHNGEAKAIETETHSEEVGLVEATEAAQDLFKIISVLVSDLNDIIGKVNSKLAQFDALTEGPQSDYTRAQDVASQVAADLTRSSERIEQSLPAYQNNIKIFTTFISDYLSSIEPDPDADSDALGYHHMMSGLLESIRAALARLRSHRKSILDMSHRSGKMKPASRRMCQAVDGVIAPMQLFEDFCQRSLARIDENQVGQSPA